MVKTMNNTVDFVWILDVSGSMIGDNMQALDYAIEESIPELLRIQNQLNGIVVQVSVLTFSDSAKWIVKQQNISDFKWNGVIAEGVTNTSKALKKLYNSIVNKEFKVSENKPVFILVTDGYSTDNPLPILKKILKESVGKNSVRLSIAIGDDVDTDFLIKFINGNQRGIIPVEDVFQIYQHIQWRSLIDPKKVKRETKDDKPNHELKNNNDVKSIDKNDVF